MDDIVRAALQKWPNVPDVYGWLGRNRRGEWLLKGEVIRHPPLIEFIARNYEADQRGCWFFQNGPQRVFVSLEGAPFCARLAPDEHHFRLGQVDHPAEALYLTDDGSIYVAIKGYPALLDDRDAIAWLDHAKGAEGTPCEESHLSGQDPLFWHGLPVQWLPESQIAHQLHFTPCPTETT